MMDAKKYMEETIRLAKTGMNIGDGGPFGAVIVRDGEIIGRGWNRVLKTNDPTAHAEIIAIRNACNRLGSYWLEDAEIYVTCEPCPMCLAAIYWARIAKLTFGASRDDAAALGFDDAFIYNEICLPQDQRKITIKRYDQEQAVKIMQQWQELADKQLY